jgi:hypothetical protein
LENYQRLSVPACSKCLSGYQKTKRKISRCPNAEHRMEEADETLYWLGLIHRSGKINPGKLRDMMNEATELLAIFVASIKTAELDNGEKYERQSKKYKRKWEGQSSKDEQRPAIPKLCTSSFVIRTSSFVTRTSRCTALNV